MFHADVAKVDLNVVMLHVFHTHVKSVLPGCCIFIKRFRMFHATETDVAAGFFSSLMDG